MPRTGPNTARNITTNYLIQIDVTDDDIQPPAATRSRGWANERSMLVSNSTALLTSSGSGQDVTFTEYDGNLVGNNLTLLFNVFDYLQRDPGQRGGIGLDEHCRSPWDRRAG